MLNAMRMGIYLRSKNTLPGKLKESAILITSRQWTQEFEWEGHSPIAIKGGLSRKADAGYRDNVWLI